MIILDKYELHLIREAIRFKLEHMQTLTDLQHNPNAKQMYKIICDEYNELLKELHKEVK